MAGLLSDRGSCPRTFAHAFSAQAPCQHTRWSLLDPEHFSFSSFSSCLPATYAGGSSLIYSRPCDFVPHRVPSEPHIIAMTAFACVSSSFVWVPDWTVTAPRPSAASARSGCLLNTHVRGWGPRPPGPGLAPPALGHRAGLTGLGALVHGAVVDLLDELGPVVVHVDDVDVQVDGVLHLVPIHVHGVSAELEGKRQPQGGATSGGTASGSSESKAPRTHGFGVEVTRPLRAPKGQPGREAGGKGSLSLGSRLCGNRERS